VEENSALEDEFSAASTNAVGVGASGRLTVPLACAGIAVADESVCAARSGEAIRNTAGMSVRSSAWEEPAASCFVFSTDGPLSDSDSLREKFYTSASAVQPKSISLGLHRHSCHL
jgi:hypothetical protein